MRNLKTIIIFALLSLGSISCNHVKKETTIKDFEQSYNLKHKAYDNELMLTIGYMQTLDSLLLITTFNTDSFCSVYSPKNNMKEVCKYGTIGNGPGEFIQPFLTYSYGNSFGLNEINKQELAILELQVKNGEYTIYEQKRLKAPYKMKKDELALPDYYFIRLDSTHFVSQVCNGENSFFSLLDQSLQPIERFGESPIQEKLSPHASFSRLHGHIAAKDGILFFAPNELPYLACYQLQSGKMQKQWSFFYNKAYYGVKNGDLLYDREKSSGMVLDLDVDKHYVYLLYLDQLLSEYDFKNPEKSLANKILIFDHEGNAVASLHLDCRLQTMALSKDSRKLYGISLLPEPTIVEFDLPNI